MGSNHQPVAPSLEFSSDSDSDCYIIDSGSEVEFQWDSADDINDAEAEAVGPMDPVSDDVDDGYVSDHEQVIFNY